MSKDETPKDHSDKTVGEAPTEKNVQAAGAHKRVLVSTKPATEKDAKAAADIKKVPEGNKPVAEKDAKAVGDNKAVPESSKPVAEKDAKAVGDNKAVPESSKPVAEKDAKAVGDNKAVPEGNKPVAEKDAKAVGDNKAVPESSKPVADKDAKAVEDNKAVPEGNKPATEKNAKAVGDNKAVPGGNKPVAEKDAKAAGTKKAISESKKPASKKDAKAAAKNKKTTKKRKKAVKNPSFLERHTKRKSEMRQLRLLPQSVKLEESANPHMIRVSMFMISLAILVFILWASVTNINEITRAEGEVVPQGFVQVVQHLEGGIITDILTKEGALVDKSQVLITMEDGSTKHDLAIEKAKRFFLNTEAERLRVFAKNDQPNFEKFFNRLKVVSIKPSAAASNLKTNSKLVRMHERSRKLKEKYLISLKALKMHESLYKKGLTSELNLFKYQKEVSEIEAEVLSELNKVEAQIAENQEVISKLENKLKRLNIRSPVYGLVKGLKVNTIGGIVQAGGTLMEIVPLDKDLVVEAKILPQDIGHIRLGQNVRVKVSSYDFSRYGVVEGKINFISATTFIDESGMPYYRSSITLSKHYLGKDPKRNLILPGMTVEADIVTGKKTILAYLLKPIHLSLKTALTER